MNFFLKSFLVAVLLVAPVTAFATTDLSIPQAPKTGDVIQISVNGYDIQAKIIKVTSQDAGTTQTTQVHSSTSSEQATQPTDNPTLLPADIQQGLDNFANSNPVKSGIEALDNAIVAQAGKWFHLDLTGKPDVNISQWPASILSSITPYFKDIKNYWYLGVALIFLVILFLLWKGKKKYDRGY